jgi:hypothetical protein
MQSPENWTERPFFFRIADGSLLFEYMCKCNGHAFENVRQVQTLHEIQGRLLQYF